MAMLPDREIKVWDVTRKMVTVASPGQFAIHATTGSGAAIGATLGSVKIEYASNIALSGAKFAGVNMHPHVVLDTTRYDLNKYKLEYPVSGACTLAAQGFVVIDNVSGTPTVGAIAYLAFSGSVSATDLGGCPVVGVFESIKDELGFAKVRFTTV